MIGRKHQNPIYEISYKAFSSRRSKQKPHFIRSFHKAKTLLCDQVSSVPIQLTTWRIKTIWGIRLQVLGAKTFKNSKIQSWKLNSCRSLTWVSIPPKSWYDWRQRQVIAMSYIRRWWIYKQVRFSASQINSAVNMFYKCRLHSSCANWIG